MKALVTLLLASLPLLASAQPGNPTLPTTVVNFSVERGLPFSLLLDGQPVTRPAAQQVHLDYLAPGQHLVELSPLAGRLGRGGQPIRATVWLAEGLETSFVLTQRPGYGWQLRQVSTAALPGYGYDDQEGTYGPPAPNGQVYAPQPGGQPAGPGYPNGPGYPAGSTAPAYPTGPGGPGYPSGPGYPGGTAGPGYPGGPSYPGGPGYPAPYSSADIADLVQALRRCTFDDKRLPIFYQAMARMYVRADDLAAMVRTMTYSESQKKVAEFGYSHLSDPQNFYRVLSALTFSTDANTILTDLGLQRQ